MDFFEILEDINDNYCKNIGIDTMEEYRQEKKQRSENETNIMLDNRDRARDMNDI